MNGNEHFNQDDVGDEEIQWTGQPARKSQIIPILVGIVMIPFGIGLLVLIGVYTRINYTTYGVTDKALYKKRGALSDKVKRVPLSKIQNTEYSRSFIEKRFGFGSVQISSAGSSGTELSFRAVDDPESLQDLINRLSKVQSTDDKTDSTGVSNEQMIEEVRKTRRNLEEISDYLENKE